VEKTQLLGVRGLGVGVRGCSISLDVWYGENLGNSNFRITPNFLNQHAGENFRRP